MTPTPDIQEEEHQEPPLSFWRKVQALVVTIAALMISAGQWNDTTEVVSNLYTATMANFTHELEYELIDNINVGNSFDYVSASIGEPQVIKRSKIKPDVQFFYYVKNKFDLTLLINDGRIVGYGLLTKQDDFLPNIPFVGQFKTENLYSANSHFNHYFFDTNNLIYYLEHKELGKQQMFLNLLLGYVEYGATPEQFADAQALNTQVAQQIKQLEHKMTFSESDQEIAEELQKARKMIFPNFYSISETEPDVVAESLLTRYEYQLYTKS
ncbi:ETEC_3214 domain-containing protein [Catenovulum sp. SX2]|uniref:ETEC_3214 domain-containing protein n=1 Tax=Catenovulum sp. SX2 TaxID=3398614 RepID=UPI003F8346D3